MSRPLSRPPLPPSLLTSCLFFFRFSAETQWLFCSMGWQLVDEADAKAVAKACQAVLQVQINLLRLPAGAIRVDAAFRFALVLPDHSPFHLNRSCHVVVL